MPVTKKNLTDDVRIASIKDVVRPEQLHSDLPLSDISAETISNTRSQISDVLHGKDNRLVVIAGPCSIHDTKAAHEYADRLAVLIEKYKKELIIVMRVYFEKPRTTIGWKGLINDPLLDGSFRINQGLHEARKLLLELNEKGVPAGTEFLDIVSPQYYADLISWGAIGARTTESQSHRELASGLSCPVGFKNGTNGSAQIAVDAIGASARPHHFLSITKHGTSAIFETTGNNDCHVILRGGSNLTNYDKESIDGVCALLEKSDYQPQVMVDMSHANSQKNPDNQVVVADNLAQQISAGDQRIFGVMIESHLVKGNQNVNTKPLTYGQSITDACIDWQQTETVLAQLADAVATRNA